MRIAPLALTIALLTRPVWAQVEAPGGTQEQVLTRAPAIVQAVDAVYPDAAKADHLTGDVTLQVDIDASGKVSDARVTKSAGHGFDEAAVQAVKQFVFSPAEINHVPAAVSIEYTLHFAYNEPPPPPPPTVDTPPTPPPVAVRGRILERATREPLMGANVHAADDSDVMFSPVESDPNGYFELRVTPGTLHLQVSENDHQTFDTHEVVPEGEALEVTYYLMPRSFGTFESVVRGTREKKEVTRHTLQREELESVPGSFGDPLRVVQDLPGLARTPYSIGGLIVRGAAAYDTGTYFDGVQLPLIFHFGAGPSVVNPEYLDRIDFYPGGFGSRYGRAIGGILDIDSRDAKTQGVHGSGKIDLIDAGVYVSVPINKSVTLSAALRRSYIDGILALALPYLTSSTTVAPSYYDYQARVDYRPEALSRHKFQLMVMGSNDILKVVTSSNGGPGFSVNVVLGFQRLNGQWFYRNDDFTLRTTAFFGFDENSAGIGTNQIDSPATVGGVRTDFEAKLHERVTLRAGLDILLRDQGAQFYASFPTNYRLFPGARPNAPLQSFGVDIGQLDFGEWVEFDFSLPWDIKIIPGFRLDEFHSTGITQLAAQPRFIIRRPFADTAVKASVGMYSEQPSIQFSNSAHGNPDLDLQRAVQTSVGAEHRFTDVINVDVTAFWSHRYNLAAPSTAVVTGANGSVQPLLYESTGVGDAYGLEVFLRHELSKHFFGWLAYTLAWSQQRDAAGKPLYFTSYDERHILTLIAQYRWGNGWELGTRFRMVTGAPTTPVADSTYRADTQTYAAVYGAAGSARLPVFHQLDFRVDKVWLFDTWQIGVYLDVQNIYNQQNADFVRFDYRYRGSVTIPDIPILPTLGVKGVF